MTALSFPTPPQRILIIKPSAIGDIVHALPVLALLRNRWPDARISWLVTPVCSGLLDNHPLLDESILFDRKGYATSWRSPSTAKRFLAFTQNLRERAFDLVIDLQGLFRSAWLARATRAPIRIGFANARELAWMFYTHRVAIDTMEQHAVDRYLKIAAALGCLSETVEFPLVMDDSDHRHIDALLPDRAPFAVLLPGANWATKRWPIEHFAELIEPLRARFGLSAVVAGGPDAAALASRLPGATNLAGQTTLRQLTALLDRASVVIANDTGPMHIAAALGRPLVTMFGPTNPVRTGPYRRMESVVGVDIPCRPCYSRACSHTSCMKWLKAESVLSAVEKQLNRDKTR